jgi:hypothetical protein
MNAGESDSSFGTGGTAMKRLTITDSVFDGPWIMIVPSYEPVGNPAGFTEKPIVAGVVPADEVTESQLPLVRVLALTAIATAPPLLTTSKLLGSGA